eukprot:TRINITY_DN19971_c0_g1_i1.p1 TRINITY_DN19971_c0_g1~~TRINITY_DN19971_c0_g1_i1.p1  ORF type:complete len:383 (-),score=97.69 TRINITY_DN19971_c0_g1_i1:206-1354(-)
MSEANKDEAAKCKQIAQSALSAGDAEKAIRFLQKAKRMSPDDSSIDGLIAAAKSGGGGPANSNNADPTSSEGQRRRTAPAGGGATSSSASSASGTRTSKDGGTYTDEQMKDVQKILRTRDYYTILGIDKDATEEQVKKAYKKLALKLHPDKNKAPGAEEAFKKLSKAVQCLTDAEKKHVYDRYGDEERIPQQQRHHYQQDFMAPEDIFAAFFGGQGFHSFPQQRRSQSQGQQQQEVNGRAQLLQMLPMLLLLLMTFTANIASQNQQGRFSWSPTSSHHLERSTANIDVNYYVANDFGDHYPEGTRHLAEFEEQVEVFYVRKLRQECDYQEKVMYRKVMLARGRGSQAEIDKAKNHPKPACKEIERIRKKHSSIYRQAMQMVY